MIDHITLHADKTTLNPLLNPGDCATLTVHVVDQSGQIVDLSKASIQYSFATIAASGDVEVVRLEDNCLVAREGGVAEVTAAVIANGTAYQSSLRFLVRPFFREYHKTLTLKLFLGQDKHPDPDWGRRVTF
jgi:hypothetical protein